LRDRYKVPKVKENLPSYDRFNLSDQGGQPPFSHTPLGLSLIIFSIIFFAIWLFTGFGISLLLTTMFLGLFFINARLLSSTPEAENLSAALANHAAYNAALLAYVDDD
jgi:hypothetical protein